MLVLHHKIKGNDLKFRGGFLYGRKELDNNGDFVYNSNMYKFKEGFFDLTDFSYTETPPGNDMLSFNLSMADSKTSDCNYPITQEKTYKYYTRKIRREYGFQDITLKYTYDEKMPFYDVLNENIGEEIKIKKFINGNGNHKTYRIEFNCNSGTFDFSHPKNLALETWNEYITMKNGVCILTLLPLNKTFFYYPGDDTIVEKNLIPKILYETELDWIVVVMIDDKKYLYDVFTHDKIEIPLNSFTNGIVVSSLEWEKYEPIPNNTPYMHGPMPIFAMPMPMPIFTIQADEQSYINIYTVEYNKYGIYD